MMRLSDEMKRLPYSDPGSDLRLSSVKMATEIFGVDKIQQEQIFINLVALRMSMGEDITIYKIDDKAAEKISSLKVECYPYECPSFMRSTKVLEISGKEFLFDTVTDIGFYWIGSHIFIFGQRADGAAALANIEPEWNGQDIGELSVQNIISGDKKELDEFAKNAFGFLVKLSLLMEADKTPIESKAVNVSSKKGRNTSSGKTYIKYISLTKKYIHDRYESKGGVLDTSGKIPVKTEISGFIRAQRFGKKFSQVKYVYVDSFESVRWNNKGDKTINIGL